MSLPDKLQNAYNHLIDKLVYSLKNAEETGLHWLGEGFTQLELKSAELDVLTKHELEQLQNLIQTDIEQTTQYFSDVKQGLNAFIENDWTLIEQVLKEKALSLADTSQIERLKLRLQAALNNK